MVSWASAIFDRDGLNQFKPGRAEPAPGKCGMGACCGVACEVGSL